MTHALHSPLTTHLINRLRDGTTDAEQFRRLVKQLTLLLANAALGEHDLKPVLLRTWQGERAYALVDESEIVFVTILRAGLPMLDAVMELFPKASAGFLAMKRDEATHEAKLYYDRVPECRGRHVVIVDPMVATGGSLSDAVTLLQQKEPARITSLHIIASPEGVEKVTDVHPELSLFVAQIDRGLSADKFILPGLGDAGDRAFNTL
ncbi:uracil phosphoribosyltransferase [Sulfurimonas sp. HSL-3221]|uniref:uracil phosphoribosyltransferase n=1 Tax=Thiomicrolovo sulfuroxydans TaxID=2894755 RepID=UPI001E3B49A3|nr:uracil phosphoribosyltransferase [Sulfurimonas sp. HSL-3221]UFS62899.1 uracil phosphoribosyltransferase [Sulfurimonas sp. HSL-3221]